ncbi:MAG: tetratricopeptide repeat protein [Desulfocapsaceae bacterium]|nr:tetratricopeptide repeat protein [Desulfocapsaceae bacterium]
MTTAGKTVKQETMLIAIAITFLLGFLTGTIFTVYKSGPSKTPAASQPANAPEQQGTTLNNEQAQAIAALETEVEKNHANGEAWTRLGNLYYDTNQFKNSIKAYIHALDLLPANADILTDLGVMYRRDNQPEKALESFDKAIQTNPRHEPSRLNKGVVLLYDLGKIPEALQAWQELLTVNPNATTANGKSVSDLIAEVTKEIGNVDKQESKGR